MKKINTGGTAFPTVDEHRQNYGEQGMTLRQYYAAKAMQSYALHPQYVVQQIVRYAFETADAMIKFEQDEYSAIGAAMKEGE